MQLSVKSKHGKLPNRGRRGLRTLIILVTYAPTSVFCFCISLSCLCLRLNTLEIGFALCCLAVLCVVMFLLICNVLMFI